LYTIEGNVPSESIFLVFSCLIQCDIYIHCRYKSIFQTNIPVNTTLPKPIYISLLLEVTVLNNVANEACLVTSVSYVVSYGLIRSSRELTLVR
jgi:hypothetical protein